MSIFDRSIVSALSAAIGHEPIEGDSDAIAERLSEITAHFLAGRAEQRDPEAAEIANELQAIQAHADGLRAHLQKLKAPCQTRYRLTAQAASERVPEGAVNEAILAVEALERWSARAIERETKRERLIFKRGGKKQSTPGRWIAPNEAPGRKADRAMQCLVNGLAEICFEYWGDAPSVSMDRDEVEAVGPFAKFAYAFLNAMETRLGLADYAQDPGLRSALCISPNGLRQRARNTPMAKFLKRDF